MEEKNAPQSSMMCLDSEIPNPYQSQPNYDQFCGALPMNNQDLIDVVSNESKDATARNNRNSSSRGCQTRQPIYMKRLRISTPKGM